MLSIHLQQSWQRSVLLLSILFSGSLLFAQKNKPADFNTIDTAIFQDASHHWYDLYEKDRVIQPKGPQPRYKATDLAAVADNILLYQKNNGGWPKNYDILAILTPEQKDSLTNDKPVLNTTFDN